MAPGREPCAGLSERAGGSGFFAGYESIGMAESEAVLAPAAPWEGSHKGAKMDLLGHKESDMPKWPPWLYQMTPLVLCV